MPQITDQEHQLTARRLKRIYSTYEKSRDLISVGAYSRGSDPAIDEAITMNPPITHFLQQNMEQKVSFDEGMTSLKSLMTQTDHLPEVVPENDG